MHNSFSLPLSPVMWVGGLKSEASAFQANALRVSQTLALSFFKGVLSDLVETHTYVCFPRPQGRAWHSTLQFDLLFQCWWFLNHSVAVTSFMNAQDGHVRCREKHLQFGEVQSQKNDYLIDPNKQVHFFPRGPKFKDQIKIHHVSS